MPDEGECLRSEQWPAITHTFYAFIEDKSFSSTRRFNELWRLRENKRDMEDRRTFARIEIKLPLKFLDSLGNKTGEGQTLNVSADGIGFLTEEKLFEEAPIEIWLDIPDHHGSLYARGEIVWTQAPTDANEKRRIGIRLEKEDLLGLARILWVHASA